VGCGAASSPSPLRGPARRLFGLLLDLNRADALTLETLPGVGPVRAAAIVQAREERPFESVEALLRVPGVGPVTLSRVAPLVVADSSAGARVGDPARSPGSALRTSESRR
jgi:competence protein ComEA